MPSLVAVTLAVLTGALPMAFAGPFTNGSFELPVLASTNNISLIQGDTSLVGWTIGGTGGPVELLNSGAEPGQTAYDGQQWIQFNAGDTAAGTTLSQEFDTIPGQIYSASCALGMNGNGTVSMGVVVSDAYAGVLVSNDFAQSGQLWRNYAVAFTAVSTNSFIEFIDTTINTYGADLLLDDVNVVIPPGSGPVITLAPTNQTAVTGIPVVFTANATGITPLTVQWYLGTNAMTSLTNASVIVTAGDNAAGVYTAVFTDSYGRSVSTSASLTVIPGPLFNGSFELPELGSGETVLLSPGDNLLTGWVISGNGGPFILFSYSADFPQTAYDGNQAIQFNATNGNPGITLSQTIATTAEQPYDVSFALATFITAPQSLAVVAIDLHGAILASNNYVPFGQNWSLFYFDFTADSTNTTLELIDTSPNNDDGVALLLDEVKVTPITGSAPAITLSPSNQSVTIGSPATFTASATGTSSLMVQWYFGTNAISGATNTSLTVTGAPANAGDYSATFTDNVGRTSSTSAAELTVLPALFINGSFELPNLISNELMTLYQSSTELVGWTIGGTGGPVELANHSGLIPYDGQQCIAFNTGNTAPGTTLSQMFTTASGQAYYVSFALATAGTGNESLGIVALDPNGNVLITNNCQPLSQSWSLFSLSFTADSTSTTLELIDTSHDTVAVDLLLDDVTVTPIVGSAPAITLSPLSQSVTAWSPATFTASASGTGPLTVQWYFGANAIGGATNTSLTITAIPSAAGYYSATFTDDVGRTISTGMAALTVLSAAFTNGSFELPELAGNTSLALTSTNISLVGWIIGGTGGPVELYNQSGPGAYDGQQWIAFNAGNTAPGSTLSQTFTTTAGQAYGVAFALAIAGTGNESLGVAALDPNGVILATNNYIPPAEGWGLFYLNFTADSTNTTLELMDTSRDTEGVDLLLDDVQVTPVTGSAPLISSSPLSQTVTAWLPATFTASATGTGPLTVQWYFGTNAISGATNTSVTVTASPASAGPYSATFTDDVGRSASTSAATLTVIPTAFTNGSFELPNLTSNTSLALTSANTSLLGWTIGGTGGPVELYNQIGRTAYDGLQWIEFNARYTAPGATLSQTFTTAAGQAYGISLALATAGASNENLGVVASDSNRAILATNNFAPTGQNWSLFYFGFTADSTNTTLTIIDNLSNVVNVALLLDNVEVTPVTGSAPVITSSPSGQSAPAWSSATFTASATGTSPLTVQWYFGTNAISGATGTNLTVTATPAAAGSYSATFTDNVGRSASTSAGTLTVLPTAFTNGTFALPNVVGFRPLSLTSTNTSLVGWVIGGTGGPVYLYSGIGDYDGLPYIQFHPNNSASGTTLSQTFTTAAEQPYYVSFDLSTGGTGNESLGVVALNPDGKVLSTNNYQPLSYSWIPFSFSFTADSTNATLEMIDTSAGTLNLDFFLEDVAVTPITGTGPVITLSPSNQSVAAWSPVTFTASATGTSSLTVQWYFGTNAITGATGTNLTVTATPTAGGSYSATFSDNVGRSTSTSSATLAVLFGPFTNGSFELPNLASNTSLALTSANASLLGWTIGGTGGPVELYNQIGRTAYDGLQWIAFNTGNTAPGATLSQTFATATGQAYGVFLALADAGTGNESLGVVALDPNGNVLATNNYQPLGQGWSPFYFNFTAVSTYTTLRVIDTSADTVGVDLLLDDVNVTPVTGNAPVVTLSPSNQSVPAWSRVTFTASATGTSPLTVQWYFGTNAITGATGANLTVTATPTAGGSYSATFTDNVGRSTSTSAATLAVLFGPFTNGSFELPNLASNTSLTLAPTTTNMLLEGWVVGATGGPVELYNQIGRTAYDGLQWIAFNTANTASGATLSQTFATATGQAYGVFLALADAGTGNESLGVVALDLNGNVLATNNYQPLSQNWNPFYFYFTAASTYTTLEMVDTSQDTIDVDLLLDDVDVTPITGSGPVITLSPSSQSVTAWSSATFNASATGGAAPLTVQWYFGTNAIPEATNTSVTLTSVPLNAGSYSAVFTDHVGRTATTAAATLTVVPPAFTNGSFEIPILPTGGSLSLNSNNMSLVGWLIGGTGGPVELYNQSGPGAYDGQQWIAFNAGDTAPGSTLSQTFATAAGQAYGVAFALAIAGTGNESLGVAAVDPNGVILATNNYIPHAEGWGLFYLNFTADSTNTTLKLIDTSRDTVAVDLLLDDVQVTPVAGSAPLISSSPLSQTVTAWLPVTFTASATGTGPLTEQWYFGTNAINGATNTSLTVTASPVSAGPYSATFTDDFGRSTSTSAATLTVIPTALTNGSFEIPILPTGGSLSLYSNNESLLGWTIGGTGGPVMLYTVSDDLGRTGYEGNQWVQFNTGNSSPGSSLSQSFTTTPHGAYDVLFALATAGVGNESMGVVALDLNGGILASNNYQPASQAWELFSFNFTADSAGTTLEFTDTSVDTIAVDLLLDDVVVLKFPSVLGAQVNGGTATIRFLGDANKLYNIAASIDLKNWEIIGSVTSGPDGSFEFVDGNASLYPCRFYMAPLP